MSANRHTRSSRLSCVLFGALLSVLISLAMSPVKAVEPDEVLQDTVLEARARHISEGLRCLVCQNQSIDDSAAPLAKDLRVLVRERLKAGDTDQQIEDFVVARYGEFVLLNPRFEPQTFLRPHMFSRSCCESQRSSSSGPCAHFAVIFCPLYCQLRLAQRRFQLHNMQGDVFAR